MVILKCKVCGGDIQTTDNTYGTCDSCGSSMTLPTAKDEKILNLFNRANHFRRLNDFDKALAIYENILNEDNTSAEAHWGVVLSRYGIEYVEDPATHKMIPTCHRVQSDSILADADYMAALEYAPDEYAKWLYEDEAKKISDIQKGILTISSKEKPYDVFICYKETTDSGSRTKDSAIGQDIYYQLTKDGYRVFFSRITLEDKLGQEYEPYIFSALNSAKVMLVIGTCKEHFEAVWVKNEWSRYLALVKKDRSRSLIPCYRDMDAYDIPDELSNLQSQDMSKVGFIQDILHGVKKVLDAAKDSGAKSTAPPTDTAATQDILRGIKEVLDAAKGSEFKPTAAATTVATTDALLKRVFVFLKEGDWERANAYCERVLDIDLENARAYIGKLCAELKVSNEANLANQIVPLNNRTNYQKALRFADKNTRAKLEEYNQIISERYAENKRRVQEFRAEEERRVAERAGKEKNKKNLGIFLLLLASVAFWFILWETDIIRNLWAADATFIQRCIPSACFSLAIAFIVVFFPSVGAGLLGLIAIVGMAVVLIVATCVWNGVGSLFAKSGTSGRAGGL